MILRSKARDCLFLNWAVPAEQLIPPPAPLTLETVEHDGVAHGFVSALLFRQHRLHDARAPRLAVSHPQCNLSMLVRDPDGQPGVLVAAVLVPWWLVPAARWIEQPGFWARFEYPAAESFAETPSWSWCVRGRGALAAEARRGMAAPRGPALGSWQETVDFFRRRSKGYVRALGKPRAVEISHPPVEAWPLQVELGPTRLAERLLPLRRDAVLPPLHSAFLCPEIPSIFELVEERPPAMRRHAPAPG